MLNEIIVSVLVFIITGIVAYVGRKAAQYLESKLSHNQIEILHKYAEQVIKQVETKYDSGSTKFTKASTYISAKATLMGIRLSPQDIQVIIEGTLKELKMKYDTFSEKK